MAPRPATNELALNLQPLHADQVRAARLREDPRGGEWAANGRAAGLGRRKVVRCGRRWGKTELGKNAAATHLAKGHVVGWFAPEYKFLNEVYEEIYDTIDTAGMRKSSNKTNGVMRTWTGGRIDFWSLDNDRAGRSRKYHCVIIDEAAYTNPNMSEIWEKSIEPTLMDYNGFCLVTSNTNGISPDNFLWQICNQPKHGFIEYYAPTINNPTIPGLERDTMERLRRGEITQEEAEAIRTIKRHEYLDNLKQRRHPLVYAQEYEAAFVDFSGVAFFDKERFLDEGQPVALPTKCDYVFAVVDTAVKTGKENDGTAITFFARNLYAGDPLIVLDWEIIQVDGDLLEVWLQNKIAELEQWSRACGARNGSLGVHIEDKQTGSILIMAGQRRGWPVHGIASVLTSVGKDERAMAVSGHHYQSKCKMSGPAYDKTTNYKGVERNHFLAQVCGYRVGVKDQADDLLDTYTYGLAIALGDAEGI